MFSDINFDFENLPRIPDEPDSPNFEPIDLTKAVKNALQANETPSDGVPISIPEVCFFSPTKILKNSDSIQDKLHDALQKQTVQPGRKPSKYVKVKHQTCGENFV